MAMPTRNTATPADESLLDLIAADHVSQLRRRVQEQTAQGDAKSRRLPGEPPAPQPMEPRDASTVDTDTGAFHSEAEIPARSPEPILVDLPAELFEEQVAPEAVEIEDVSYQAAPAEPPAVIEKIEEITLAPIPEPQPTPSDKNLAEEILSLQMAEEMQLETADMLDAVAMEKTIEESIEEQDSVIDSILPIEESLKDQEDDDILLPPLSREQHIETPAASAVKPKPVIAAIRPPAQPSRVRSLLVQVLIVLLSLTAVGMVAYMLGILKLFVKQG